MAENETEGQGTAAGGAPVEADKPADGGATTTTTTTTTQAPTPAEPVLDDDKD